MAKNELCGKFMLCINALIAFPGTKITKIMIKKMVKRGWANTPHNTKLCSKLTVNGKISAFDVINLVIKDLQ